MALGMRSIGWDEGAADGAVCFIWEIGCCGGSVPVQGDAEPGGQWGCLVSPWINSHMQTSALVSTVHYIISFGTIGGVNVLRSLLVSKYTSACVTEL